MILSKNKIRTPGYFIKRLKDNGFIVWRMFNNYGKHDSRRWTILVDPGHASVFITCYTNREFLNDIMFEFSDGGQLFQKNFSLKTESIETVIDYLIKRGVQNNYKNNQYLNFKKTLNNYSEEKEQ